METQIEVVWVELSMLAWRAEHRKETGTGDTGLVALQEMPPKVPGKVGVGQASGGVTNGGVT